MIIDIPENGLLRSLCEADLAQLHERYLNDQNPYWVCEAFVLADRDGLPQPDWVLNHFLRLAREVVEIGMEIRTEIRHAPKNGLKGNEHHRVLRALGLVKGRGRRPAFAELLAFFRDELMLWGVLNNAPAEPVHDGDELVGWTPTKLEAAYASVAREFGVDCSTVKRAARRHLQRIKDKDLLVRGASSVHECHLRDIDESNEALGEHRRQEIA